MLNINLIITLLLITIFGYSQEQNQILFSNIVEQYSGTKNVIKSECYNDEVLRILKKRKDSHYILYTASTNNKLDSLSLIHFKETKVTIDRSDNDYLNYGQGDNKVAEDFLNDHFILDEVKNIWSYKNYNYSSKKYNLIVSYPVYNSDYTKAIVIVNHLQEHCTRKELLFFNKKNGRWEKVFSQSEEKNWIK